MICNIWPMQNIQSGSNTEQEFFFLPSLCEKYKFLLTIIHLRESEVETMHISTCNILQIKRGIDFMQLSPWSSCRTLSQPTIPTPSMPKGPYLNVTPNTTAVIAHHEHPEHLIDFTPPFIILF